PPLLLPSFQCDDALRHLLKGEEQDVMGRAGVSRGVDVGLQVSRRDVAHVVTVEAAHFSSSSSCRSKNSATLSTTYPSFQDFPRALTMATAVTSWRSRPRCLT